MPLLIATVTDAARRRLPQQFGGMVAFSGASYFKVGLGGWINPGAGNVPRVPDLLLTDLDILINPGHYPGIPSPPFTQTFQKSFAPGDLIWEGPYTLRCDCLLDFGDYNDDGTGGSPVIWEIGVFDAANVMLGYGTYSGETKTNAKQVLNTLRFVF